MKHNALACQSGWGHLFSFITELKKHCCEVLLHLVLFWVCIWACAATCVVACVACHVYCVFMWCIHEHAGVFIHPRACFYMYVWLIAYLWYMKREWEKGKCILTHYARVMKLYLHRLCIQFALTSLKKNVSAAKMSQRILRRTQQYLSVSQAIFPPTPNTHTQPSLQFNLMRERRGKKSNNVWCLPRI